MRPVLLGGVFDTGRRAVNHGIRFGSGNPKDDCKKLKAVIVYCESDGRGGTKVLFG